MLDQNIKTQLKAYLERLESPIELVAALDDSDKAAKIKELVTEIAELSDQVTARFDGQNTRRPSFVLPKSVNNHVCSLRVYRWVMSLPH
ncbi:alkyl hydroperoxide reductase [Acinetobacter ursingii]|uniref:alkyl hydroperoxide reductase n=1 Tax=Acinetobacter ursingii TaxID=108980 RepID=UPI0039B78F37